jgi:peptidoglycan/LPS O-acetylase OafA/YrhL
VTNIPPSPQAHPVSVPLAPPALGWPDILTHLTFTFGFFPKYAASNALPDWSIGLEMQFYFALPFIMLLYRRAGHFVSTLLLMGIWIAATRLIGFGPDMPPGALGHFPMAAFLPLKLNCFVVGILFAESFHFKDRNLAKSMLLCLLGLIVVRFTFDRYAKVLACLSAVMLLYRGSSAPVAVRKSLDALRGVFGSRFAVFLADTSYGVYLFHLLVLWPFAAWLSFRPAFRHLPGIERFLVIAGMTALVAYPTAWLLHRYVEQPGIKLGKRFIRHSKPPAARVRQISPAAIESVVAGIVPQ